MGSVQDEKPSEGVPKTHVRELRNTELVSRLLAATPPYLYSALPLQPHAFFFSEMLRSFVSARQGCRPPHYHRRFKRRSHKYFAENENEWRRDWPKPEEDKKENEIRSEVPLELTVDKQPRVCSPVRRLSPKVDHSKPSSPGPPGRQSTFVDVGTEELPKPAPCVGRSTLESNTIPPSNLILPPPPPMWYPPIYNPQFGVDPLNFFIDLRVSGHIYDRKRLANETDVSQDRPEDVGSEKTVLKDFGQKPRHLSAFSVPVRSHAATEGADKYYDQTTNRYVGKQNSSSYIMKNLKRVYDNLHPYDRKDESKTNDDCSDSKEESLELEDDVIE